ncbi:MAG: hypothetical protein N4A76_01070 [Firmicutes bacterium]|jgi:hypothetical protein|nr:hypothetical protein [Bacillota bacterium]
MSEIVRFKELQKPAKYLNYLVIGFSIIAVILALITQEWFLIGLAIGLYLFIRSVELEMIIYEDRISYKCVPFKFTYTDLSFEDIDDIYIGKYNARFKYKGFKVKKAGKYEGYFFGGYDVIQIKMKSGRVIIISSKKIDEVRNIIENKSL